MNITYAGKHFDLVGVNEHDHVSRVLIRSGSFYEEDLLRYLTQMNLKRGVVIDVGAQIGNHSVFFANFLADQVISVEPNPDVLPALLRNTKANPGHYTLIPAGLGERPGTASIRVPDKGNIGTAQLVAGGAVSVTTLDAIAPDDVVLVKVDVEGMELEVLRGGLQLLSTQRPDLVLEAGTVEAAAAHRAFLDPLGYVPLSRWAATPTWHYAWQPSLARRLRAKRLRFSYKALAPVRRYWKIARSYFPSRR